MDQGTEDIETYIVLRLLYLVIQQSRLESITVNFRKPAESVIVGSQV